MGRSTTSADLCVLALLDPTRRRSTAPPIRGPPRVIAARRCTGQLYHPHHPSPQQSISLSASGGGPCVLNSPVPANRCCLASPPRMHSPECARWRQRIHAGNHTTQLASHTRLPRLAHLSGNLGTSSQRLYHLHTRTRDHTGPSSFVRLDYAPALPRHHPTSPSPICVILFSMARLPYLVQVADRHWPSCVVGDAL